MEADVVDMILRMQSVRRVLSARATPDGIHSWAAHARASSQEALGERNRRSSTTRITAALTASCATSLHCEGQAWSAECEHTHTCFKQVRAAVPPPPR